MKNLHRFLLAAWAELIGFVIIVGGLIFVIAPLCFDARDDLLFWVGIGSYIAAPIAALIIGSCLYSAWRRYRQSIQSAPTQEDPK